MAIKNTKNEQKKNEEYKIVQVNLSHLLNTEVIAYRLMSFATICAAAGLGILAVDFVYKSAEKIVNKIHPNGTQETIEDEIDKLYEEGMKRGERLMKESEKLMKSTTEKMKKNA